ncbi:MULTISPECIES: 4,5-DOPA dioxygenase extradiol [unclassified Nitrosospira]|uniref:4,5-DOPA-extradiol-dioxygenase n=1 Tax=unclassified Nitrosospira TaxID=2609267 RepID=UPI000D30BD37|nr:MULTISPECIES: 4,5-DOPA dioxygenase extradiol [unclassified Nitrosospira]PTR17451.1 4,5-DOPA dioxygenase extradiol [Nitrosospira sp. Nsp2]WON74244.1 4,5-DOPA dioxygenase extradiol [Nitrosospira sp. Is2]
MPAIFVGHGNPMNALSHNAFTNAWSEIRTALPAKPKAVLCISAHWYVPKTAVTAMPKPRTIHDFGGFPPELFKVEYPAPGSLEFAAEVADLLSPDAIMDTSWGLDHGTWSVLMHIFPAADIPVVQLSIDETREPAWHYHTARKLAPLRDREVLILGSGNIVHNLHTYAWGKHHVEPYDWALRFEKTVRKALSAGDAESLVAYETLGRDALLSVPTPDHYLPFLYVLAQRRENEPIMFPAEGFDGGSISMLAVKIG